MAESRLSDFVIYIVGSLLNNKRCKPMKIRPLSLVPVFLLAASLSKSVMADCDIPPGTYFAHWDGIMEQYSLSSRHEKSWAASKLTIREENKKWFFDWLVYASYE